MIQRINGRTESSCSGYVRTFFDIVFNKHKPSCSRILEKAVWSNLRNLNLFDCDLLDDDLYDLTRGHFPVLDKLYLPSNQFGNEGIISLCRGSWADLCELYICRLFVMQGESKSQSASSIRCLETSVRFVSSKFQRESTACPSCLSRRFA